MHASHAFRIGAHDHAQHVGAGVARRVGADGVVLRGEVLSEDGEPDAPAPVRISHSKMAWRSPAASTSSTS